MLLWLTGVYQPISSAGFVIFEHLNFMWTLLHENLHIAVAVKHIDAQVFGFGLNCIAFQALIGCLHKKLFIYCGIITLN